MNLLDHKHYNIKTLVMYSNYHIAIAIGNFQGEFHKLIASYINFNDLLDYHWIAMYYAGKSMQMYVILVSIVKLLCS